MTTDIPTIEKKNSLAAKLLRPKVAIPLLIVFLLLISPFLIRGWYLRGVPDVPEPFDLQPIREFKVAEEDNAYTGYAEALDLFVEPKWDLREKSNHVLQTGWKAADNDIRQFLKDNERALLVWKEATQKDQAQYLPADEYAWDQVLTVAGEARSFNRGALMLAQRHMADDELEQAWKWYRAAIRFSRHLGKNGGLVERLVGVDCFEMTARELEVWLADPEVDQELILSSMQQMKQDWQLTEDNATTIKIEYLSLSNLVEKIENGEADVPEIEGHRDGMLSMNDGDTPNIIYYFLGEPELGHRLANIFFCNKLKFYSLPPYRRPSQTGELGLFDDSEGLLEEYPEFKIADFDRSIECSQVARATIPAMHQAMIDTEADELRYRTLLVIFAGQAFRRDHGLFPETLDELVPEYLDSIPIDTYDGQPLKYRFDPDGPVVYSIFENMTDEGGVEWIKENLPPGKGWPDDYGSQMRLPEPELLPPVNPLPEVMQHDRISLPHQRLLFVLPEQQAIAFIESDLQARFHILE